MAIIFNNAEITKVTDAMNGVVAGSHDYSLMYKAVADVLAARLVSDADRITIGVTSQ